MENISKNTKRLRGRPHKIAEWERRLNQDVHTPRSARHQNNTVYKTRAIGFVANDPRFEWLCSDEATIMRGEGHMRHTILSELGRIENDQAREAIALYLCETKPTTRRAVAFIRGYRLGKRPSSTAEQLADVIRCAINTYLREHDKLAWDDVRQALYQVLSDIDATEGKKERACMAAPVVSEAEDGIA
jgi:hypothetical protein